jgi:hypothetical protein
LQLSLLKDRQGLKLCSHVRFFKFYREYTWVMKEDPDWDRDTSHLTPKAKNLEDVVPSLKGKPLEPKDI